MKNEIIKTPTPWSEWKKFALTWALFTTVAIAIGAPWHTTWFGQQYSSFNFITATEVIIPLALISMLSLGLISTYFFRHIYKPHGGTFDALKTALIVVVVPIMGFTFAYAAEQDVNGHVLSLILLEFGLYTTIALVWGLVSGKIYKH